MNFRQKTILKKLLFPIMLILIIQAVFFVIIITQGGIIPKLRQNAFDILNERVINRTQYFENEMIHRWSAISESEETILMKINEILEREGKRVSEIQMDASLNNKIILELGTDIIYMLRKNSVTGAYIILDGPCIEDVNKDNNRAGLYIRDLDPTTFSINNADILVERGLPNITSELGLSLDSYWEAGFDFQKWSENEEILLAPFNAAVQSNNKVSKNFAHWSQAFHLSGKDGKVVTYSIPLIADDGTVFGVLGVDLTEHFIKSNLKYDELVENKAGAYILAIGSEDGAVYNTVISNGSMYEAEYSGVKVLETKGQIYRSIYEFQKTNENKIYSSVQKLNLYNNNTPFSKEQWVLIGMVRESELLIFAHSLNRIILLTTIISLLLGAFAVFFVSRIITRPISILAKEVGKADPNQIVVLKRIQIKEIDQLTLAIEKLSHSVAESASRISKIITMAQIPVGVFEYNSNFEKVFCSRKLKELMGWDLEDDKTEYMDRFLFEERMSVILQYLADKKQMIFQMSKQGQNYWFRLTYTLENGQILGVIIDITDDMMEKEKIEHDRNYDQLTNIFNSRAFLERLGMLFKEKDQLKIAAVLMFDLDNLKYMNDNYGHEYGDQYIKALANMLLTFEHYGGIVARRSGDEFYVFLHGFETKEQIIQIISTVWKRILETSIELPGNKKQSIKVSGGYAWYPEDSDNYEELLRYADFAMYGVKHSIKGDIKEFNSGQYAKQGYLVNGQEALDQLIDFQMVKYAFQPIVSAKDGSIYGYEMLMRPMVSELSSPSDVLNIARAQSKLYQIERLTWFTAMKEFVLKVQSGKIEENTKVFINSIGNHIMTPRDIELFATQFKDYLSNVILEFMEGDQNDMEIVDKKLKVIRQWNGMTAIDDFGSGYNTEGALIFLSPDLVKVDISIVRGIDKDINRLSILKNLISYTKTRNVKVLAEGVETKEELEVLVASDVDYLQGYYIGKPGYEIKKIEDTVVEDILKSRRRDNHGNN